MIELYIDNVEVDLNIMRFPDGAIHYNIHPFPTVHNDVTIACDFTNSNELMLVCMLADDGMLNKDRLVLEMVYCPYSRQDRKTSVIEPFSLKTFSRLINSCNFDEVKIYDPHSDVMPALLDRCNVVGREIIIDMDIVRRSDIVISPDAGAMKKNHNLCSMYGKTHIVATKVRDLMTGNITETQLHTDVNLEGKNLLVVDDICDGGRTFIELSKILKKYNPESLNLFITFGLFSRGRGKLTEYYDTVDCYYNFMRKQSLTHYIAYTFTRLTTEDSTLKVLSLFTLTLHHAAISLLLRAHSTTVRLFSLVYSISSSPS